jgi:hypothetical protein
MHTNTVTYLTLQRDVGLVVRKSPSDCFGLVEP